jgi:hypothetical protein
MLVPLCFFLGRKLIPLCYADNPKRCPELIPAHL